MAGRGDHARLLVIGVHRRAMARLPEWRDEAALVYRVQEVGEPPSGQRRIGACNQRAGVLGSVRHRRRSADCVDAVSGAVAHFQQAMMMDVGQAAKAGE